MSEFSTPYNQPGSISFDAAEDLTECRCGSSEMYDHLHTDCCGKKAYTQDGGLQDGFVKCTVCKDALCVGHAKHIEENQPLCDGCYDEEARKIFDDALLENDLANASEDIRNSHKRMLRETDTIRVANLNIHLSILETQIALYRKAIDAKLAAHRALPFVFGSVA